MNKEKAKHLIRNAESYVNDIEPIYLSNTEDSIVEAIRFIIKAIKELE